MSDLRELYQEVILDHGKSPRNFRVNEGANRTAKGYNPLCGDQVQIYLQIDEQGIVQDVSFQGSGCAISTASNSMMTQILKGKTLEQARQAIDGFHQLITAEEMPELESLGKLAVFAGVRDYPNRVKCATLGWHTVRAAMEGSDEPVSTE